MSQPRPAHGAAVMHAMRCHQPPGCQQHLSCSMPRMATARTPLTPAHRATTGVRPSVMGVRTGNSALLHRKASARVEEPPVSTLSIQPLF